MRTGLTGLILAFSTAALPAADVDFAHQVVPILKEHCAKCHTGDKKKGGLAMNTRAELLKGSENGAVVIPGDSAKSLMLELIRSNDEEKWMPPKDDRVSADQIAILAQWVDAGLPWTEGFTFGHTAWEPPLKPRTVSLPAGNEGRPHPIDRILDADLAKRKQSLPESISDAEFLRRASLDVHGLLPTPDMLKAFLMDPSPQKRSALIDTLLADDIAYADHWLTMWNDLLRNDYTGTGFITGGRKQITSWLYDALRANKPYNQFARELIAPGADSAGFIDGIKWRGEVNSSQYVEIQFAQNVSQVFLGINMKCASCHDSFIDRWTLEEAYNLAAVYSDTPLELNRCDKPTGKMAVAKWMFPELGDIDAASPKPERLKQLATLMTHEENGRFSRTLVNRIWHRLMGLGIVHPVDAMHTRPWNEDLLDYLAMTFTENGYDMRKLMKHIMESQAYQSECVVLEADPGTDYVYAGPIARRLTAEQFMDAVFQITGSHPEKMEAKVNRSESASPTNEVATAQTRPIRAALVNNDFLMSSLGRPNRDQVVSTRPGELTTLQAIDLSNGEALAQTIAHGAKRLAGLNQSPVELIEWLFAYALSREPTPDELDVLKSAAGEGNSQVALEDVLWPVFMLPEFQIVR